MGASAEADLIARCRRGEEPAWDELFDRHYDAAGRFIFQLASDFTREDVEEVTQEVFITVIRNLHTFKGRSQLQTWIYRIAANKARDYREKQRAAKRGGGQVILPLDHRPSDDGPPLDAPSREPAPDARLLSLERADLVSQALVELGEPCREMIELRYFGDLSYEELGKALQLNLKTVSSRLSRCLDRLEHILRAQTARENPKRFPV